MNKIFSILAAFLLVFAGIGSAAAANSATLTTSVTIPTNVGMSVDKTAFNWPNLVTDGTWKNSTESPMTISNTGNVNEQIMGKIGTASPNISYGLDGKTLGTTDISIVSSISAGNNYAGIPVQAKALNTVPAGTYGNSIVLTAVAV